jgi:hypothetical protein
MPKYIEELHCGDTFIYNNLIFLITSDFKKNKSRLAFNLSSGQPKWFESSVIVNISPIYILDSENNIIAIKQSKETENHENNKTVDN